MKPGDLVRLKFVPAWARSMDANENLVYTFLMCSDDVGVLIEPNSWAHYAKVLMRDQIVSVEKSSDKEPAGGI
jgi:hypothetical protein